MPLPEEGSAGVCDMFRSRPRLAHKKTGRHPVPPREPHSARLFNDDHVPIPAALLAYLVQFESHNEHRINAASDEPLSLSHHSKKKASESQADVHRFLTFGAHLSTILR